MWWLTLRLQRAELILLITVAVAITIPFFLTADQGRIGEQQRREGMNFTAATCPGDWVTYPTGDSGCQWAPSYFYQSMNTYADGFVGLPIIVAVLLAIPVVMQLQSRSYRVAWTQTPLRDRWALTHIALILGVGLAISAGMIVLMRWWPLDIWEGWSVKSFDLRGVVNLGWYALSVGLVLALATLVRRPLIALVLAVVGYGVIRAGWYLAVRPRLIPPREETTAATGFLDQPGAWIVEQWNTRADGTRLSGREFSEICSFEPNRGGPGTTQEEAESAARAAFETYRTCLDSNELMTHYSYQPESRYWPLQFIETGLLVAIGLALIGWTVWYWLRRLE